ncbi:glutamate--cysteine ligase catalytic subunit-like isoform X2 [Bradysia coprophila]|uniref:glutamate--cysteine ligase catalytic subunit-like isoform X2 n=1 Tax=Bradysia coprophila TaxID=38358 RepID=UPI00187DD337|nr:glutamate--cysteine ligase catalytic subunit-like isoform X2 [Bradysia coprophila]
MMPVSLCYPYEESKKHIPTFRSRAAQQLVTWYEQVRDRTKYNELLWGDELEFTIVSMDSTKKQVKLSLSAHSILDRIRRRHAEENISDDDEGVSWFPEYTKYLIEGIPAQPYDATLEGLLKVESLMKLRKSAVQPYLSDKNDKLVTLTSYPRLGVGEYSRPYIRPNHDEREGDSISDRILYPTSRFNHGSMNFTERRRYFSRLNVPIYQDNDRSPTWSDSILKFIESKTPPTTDNCVVLDHNVFGNGCACLQVTFQNGDFQEALYLHDHLAPIAPLMLALSAAGPIFKGYLLETDCRWYIASYTFDDRTPDERKVKEDQPSFIPQRPRYGSIPRYMSNVPERYNDINVPYNDKAYQTFSDSGFDKSVGQFYSHILSYEPFYIPRILMESDAPRETYDEAESILGSTWLSVRVKFPPVNSTMGWRVEFRTMEIQLSDFENAAFAVFMNLLVRTMVEMKLNFLVPISKIDENMTRSQIKDAARQQKFWFRKNIFSQSQTDDENSNGNPADTSDEYASLSLDQIFNGEANGFVGLIPLIHRYLDGKDVSAETRSQLNKYLDLVRDKANGTRLTSAQLIREFVLNHPSYQNDSYVSEEINYDLINHFF